MSELPPEGLQSERRGGPVPLSQALDELLRRLDVMGEQAQDPKQAAYDAARTKFFQLVSASPDESQTASQKELDEALEEVRRTRAELEGGELFPE